MNSGHSSKLTHSTTDLMTPLGPKLTLQLELVYPLLSHTLCAVIPMLLANPVPAKEPQLNPSSPVVFFKCYKDL